VHDDASTLAPVAQTARSGRGAIGLTIAYHPDVSRIGERCLFEGSTLEVSRATPMFAPPRDGEPRPLNDRYLSRSPSLKLERVAGGLTLEAVSSAVVAVDGRQLAGAAGKAWQTYDEAALGAGLTIELADRIVLVLHTHDPSPQRQRPFGLVGESSALEQVRADIERVADLDVPVLIRGESGTGKELVARALHDAGRRSKRPFVGINVAALPPTTAASELFGHARGAFTGAAADHDGLFVRADAGTLFLDEIGEAPIDVQPMLLRVLETSEVIPLGASKPRKVDVRLIAATDADLEMQIAESSFREALFHRLAGFQLLLPTLRERREDVGRLLVHFLRAELSATGDLRRLERQHEQATLWLPAALVARLVRHSWPGNVRQLRNAARQLAIASRGAEKARVDAVLDRLLAAFAPSPSPIRSESPPDVRARRDVNTISDDELLAALRDAGWRAASAAERLGVSRSTLYVLIDKCPRIRKAKSIPEDELRRIRDEHGGDLDAMAAVLEVSRRALQIRLSELGLS
jgi:two-component system, NtrC family, nitrogen regulation response regulator GlnG